MGVITKKFDTVVDAVLTECGIYALGRERQEPLQVARAVWDTGSTNTVLSTRVVRQLGLTPFHQAGISGVGGTNKTNTYIVHVGLPTGDVVTDVEVLENEFEDYDVIIGMDIISLGDFCFTNADDCSMFSFRIPAEEHIELK